MKRVGGASLSLYPAANLERLLLRESAKLLNETHKLLSI
jgi:hypothetical protein